MVGTTETEDADLGMSENRQVTSELWSLETITEASLCQELVH